MFFKRQESEREREGDRLSQEIKAINIKWIEGKRHQTKGEITRCY